MKILILITSIAFFIACNNEQDLKSINTETKKEDSISAATLIIDSNLWIEDFRNFRDAVYKRDIEKVITYFDFPINKEGEGIWFFAKNADDFFAKSDSSKKFTEKEFYKYFDKIFSKEFVKTLLKIKTKDLLTEHETQSIEIKEGKFKKYFLSIGVDSLKKSLYLNLDIDDVFIQKDGDINPMEFSTILVFDIIDDYKKIKYRLFTFAG